MGNPSPKRDAEKEVGNRAKRLGTNFVIEHKRGTGGWWHAVAKDVATGGTLLEPHNGREIQAAYRPIVGDR